MSDELWVIVLTKEQKFRRSSMLTTHCSLLKNVWKTWIRIAGGFQALGFLWLHNKGVCKDAERQPSPHVRVFADAIFFVLPIIPRVQEPAAIRPSGFASFRRLSAINVYHYVMLNLFQHLTASLSSSSPRTDPEICDLARAEPNLLELCRAWANCTKLNKLRMTW